MHVIDSIALADNPTFSATEIRIETTGIMGRSDSHDLNRVLVLEAHALPGSF